MLTCMYRLCFNDKPRSVKPFKYDNTLATSYWEEGRKARMSRIGWIVKKNVIPVCASRNCFRTHGLKPFTKICYTLSVTFVTDLRYWFILIHIQRYE